MSQSLNETIKVLFGSAIRHRVAMVVLFMLVSCAVVVVGLSWPKTYLSYTTIYIDDTKTIQPFMVGRVVATEVQDRARFAREILFSRKVFDEIFKVAGWADLDPAEKEIQGDGLESRTTLTNLGKNLVRIEYSDSDAERTYAVTKQFADSFISEILSAKIRGSEETLEFIEKQLKVYHGKLVDAETKLNDFRAKHPGVTPDSAAEVRGRLERLRETIENTNTERKEAQVRKAGLEQLLSGESSGGTVDPNLERLAELERQLADLRMKYHDDYPDIVSLELQIEEIKRLPSRTTAVVHRDSGAAVGGVDLYTEWRRQLAEANALIRALSVRLEETERFLRDEQRRAHRIDNMQAELTELQREYETNQDSYRDLIRRRENARVSLELDRTQPELTFQIQEPASIPVRPIGLRFLHFMLAGIVLGIALPLFLLRVFLNHHPRIRERSLIPEKLGVVVLEAIPHYFSPRERRHWVAVNYCLGVALILYVAAYATMGILRFKGLI